MNPRKIDDFRFFPRDICRPSDRVRKGTSFRPSTEEKTADAVLSVVLREDG
jgi:hypothetical protein